MMNVTAPRKAGHRVLRRAARPSALLRLPAPEPAPAAPAPTPWQRLRQWLWPRPTPEQLHARVLREQSGEFAPRVHFIGGHPLLLTPPEPAGCPARGPQSDLP